MQQPTPPQPFNRYPVPQQQQQQQQPQQYQTPPPNANGTTPYQNIPQQQQQQQQQQHFQQYSRPPSQVSQHAGFTPPTSGFPNQFTGPPFYPPRDHQQFFAQQNQQQLQQQGPIGQQPFPQQLHPQQIQQPVQSPLQAHPGQTPLNQQQQQFLQQPGQSPHPQQGAPSRQLYRPPTTHEEVELERKRVSLLLDINGELLTQTARLQATDEGGTILPPGSAYAQQHPPNGPGKPASPVYVANLRSLQSNIAFLATAQQRGRVNVNSGAVLLPGPALMDPPLGADEKVKTLYERLVELFPGWKGAPMRGPSQGAGGGPMGGPPNTASQMGGFGPAQGQGVPGQQGMHQQMQQMQSPQRGQPANAQQMPQMM